MKIYRKKFVAMLLISLIPIALAISLEVRQKLGGTGSIVFVQRYQNGAWGYQCNGSFIDSWGNVYEFDYSDQERGMSEEEFRQALWETYCNTKPVLWKICNSRKLFEILQEDVYEIDRSAGSSRENTAFDAGQNTLYVCDCDFELIKLRSVGDITEEMQDKTAKKLCNYYDKIMLVYDIYKLY